MVAAMPPVAIVDELDASNFRHAFSSLSYSADWGILDFHRVLESFSVFHYILHPVIGRVLIVMLSARTLDSVVDTIAWAMNGKSTCAEAERYVALMKLREELYIVLSPYSGHPQSDDNGTVLSYS
jgi:hypothetical protein